MGTDDLFHKSKKRLERKLAIRSALPRILIVCEGEETEPNYFKAFPITSAEVVVIGDGYNTKSLVEYSKKKVAEAKKDKLPYSQVWCVFDRDSFTKEQFNAAIQMAEQSGFKVAYSNEAFELWYILHFEYLTSGLNRERYKNKLTQNLGEEYQKNSVEMYDILLDKQGQAIKFAKKLQRLHDDSNYADKNPATTVFTLVEELNAFKRLT